MFTALLLLVVQTEPITLNGRCSYPHTLPAPEAGELRVFCDSVTITAGEGPDDRLISFSRSGSGTAFGFAGKATGDETTVSHMVLRQGVVTAKTGKCRIFRKNTSISAISCVAKVGARTYVANFKPALP
jgi:hypothetical protein